MGDGRAYAVPLAILLLFSGLTVLAGGADAAASKRIYPFEDLLFTDISAIEEVRLLGDGGYVAATRGGLVVWTGEGDRRVLTRSDGLPSNIVWDLEVTDRGVLVATEHGAVSVDLGTFDVTQLTATGAANRVLTGHTIRAADIAGTWHVLDRNGNIAYETPQGTWATYPKAPGDWANDGSLTQDHILVTMETEGHGGFTSSGIHLLQDGAWKLLTSVDDSAARATLWDGKLLVGMREEGVKVFTENGGSLDAEQPESLSRAHIKVFEPFGEELWIGSTAGLHILSTDDTWRNLDLDALPHPWVLDVVPLSSTAT
ncbi:MAG: hypothetical protein R3185_07695, partial [Candidatus Thermoplasmatota archaeon]|nr:hypothetical protein [Candidatus Thermoplasmatota archaeon]